MIDKKEWSDLVLYLSNLDERVRYLGLDILRAASNEIYGVAMDIKNELFFDDPDLRELAKQRKFIRIENIKNLLNQARKIIDEIEKGVEDLERKLKEEV